MQALLEHITARVAVIDREHRFVYANREALAFYGRPLEQVIGRHLADVAGPAVHASYLPFAERLFGGETLRWRGWVDYPDHGRVYLHETMVPFAPEGGVVEAVVVYGRDHTALKLREDELAVQLQRLHASEALKSAIVDHALAALVSTDAEGNIVEFNPSAEAMFVRRRADVIGQPVSEVLIPERFRAAHREGMIRLAAGAAPRALGNRMELHALRSDGTEFPIEMVLWRTDAGGAVFYTASMVDTTERHHTAQQVGRQREALRQSEKLSAMGSLLAGVAHELNNPLAIVMGRASLLEEKCEDADLRADVLRIREAAERCGRIVRTFLNMARNRPALRVAVDMNELVRAAADMLLYSFRTHGIELDLSLAPSLPSINADGDQVGQVVLNLLVNAQQAMSGTAGPHAIRVATGVEHRRRGREPRVWLRVADTGTGVPAELRSRIFEPFFTTKGEGMGTGLGLAVSRAVVLEHGGDLNLEHPAPPDGGASFRMSLPISGMAIDETGPVPLDAPDAPMLSRVLVVDDEPELASLMRDLLEQAGYEVATAESGALALALLDEARFDAIVSDLRMPDMDGAGLWREVLDRHPLLAQRMLFVTGDTLSPDARDFLRTARCGALDKPFSKAGLLAGVKALLAE
jgi:two-component system NtrC family sensor kinase